MNSKLELSIDNGATWQQKVVLTRQQLPDLRIRIKQEVGEEIYISFPVYNSFDNGSIPENQTFCTVGDWSKFTFKTYGGDAYTVEPREGNPGGVMFEPRDAQTFSGYCECSFSANWNDLHLSPEAGVDIALWVRPENERKAALHPAAARIDFIKTLAAPVISKFAVSESVTYSMKPVQLSLQVQQTDEVQVFDGYNSIFFYKCEENRLLERTIPVEPMVSTEYRIVCRSYKILDGQIAEIKTSERSVKVLVVTDHVPHIRANPFSNGKIKSIFCDESVMIALVEEDLKKSPGKTEPDVYVWESSDGIAWNKMMDADGPVKLYDHVSRKSIAYPYSESPGIIFNRKLYLIGGSRITNDDDNRANRFYSYDLEKKNGWVDRGEVHKDFLPRMGHAVQKVNGQIWVMGGTTASGGLDDVWCSDAEGMNFSRKKMPNGQNFNLPEKLTVFSSVVKKDALYLIGGYKEIIAKSNALRVKDIQFCALDTLEWKNFFKKGLPEKMDFIFSNCTAICDGERITVIFGTVDPYYFLGYTALDRSNSVSVNPLGIPLSENTYMSIEGVFFKNCHFFFFDVENNRNYYYFLPYSI